MVEEAQAANPDELLEEVMVRSKHHFQTETTFDPKASVGDIVALLLQRKTVGFLRIDLSQGSIQKTSLTERSKHLNEKEFADVEEVLDMNQESD